MRCLYCYNPDIVYGKGKLSFEEAISFLISRKNLLEAVVFSGGECMIHKNFIAFVTQVKKLGFLVKIDTNGSSPEVMRNLLFRDIVDYVALDFKAPKSKFNAITKSNLYESFEKTLELIEKAKIPFEVRTTYHSDLLTEEDLMAMVHFLETKNYVGNYYIQYFRNDVNTISQLQRCDTKIDVEKLSTPSIKIMLRE